MNTSKCAVLLEGAKADVAEQEKAAAVAVAAERRKKAIADYRSLLVTRSTTITSNDVYGNQDYTVGLLTRQVVQMRNYLTSNLKVEVKELNTLQADAEGRPVHPCGEFSVSVVQNNEML